MNAYWNSWASVVEDMTLTTKPDNRELDLWLVGLMRIDICIYPCVGTAAWTLHNKTNINNIYNLYIIEVITLMQTLLHKHIAKCSFLQDCDNSSKQLRHSTLHIQVQEFTPLPQLYHSYKCQSIKMTSQHELRARKWCSVLAAEVHLDGLLNARTPWRIAFLLEHAFSGRCAKQ